MKHFDNQVTVSPYTLSTIEWRLTPGNAWLAEVSVEYTKTTADWNISVEASEKGLSYHFTPSTTPEELTSTLRLAEIAAGSPESCIPVIAGWRSFTPYSVSLGRMTGIVRVHLTSPNLSHGLSITDLPGRKGSPVHIRR